MFQTLTFGLVVPSQLKRSYGDVFSLFIGPRPAVVINGFKAIKEAMVIKAADFAGRPQDMFLNDLSKEQGRHHVVGQIMYKQYIHRLMYSCHSILSLLSAFTGFRIRTVTLKKTYTT